MAGNWWRLYSTRKMKRALDAALRFDEEGGGSGTPGGADTNVQFNDGNAFGGNSALTYDKTAKTLSLANASKIKMGQLYSGELPDDIGSANALWIGRHRLESCARALEWRQLDRCWEVMPTAPLR